MRQALRWAGILAAVLGGVPAWANDTRYADVVVGARASGMGGAFTAISDDSSGLIYNPAGMVDVKRANLSVSTNLYGFERKSQGGIFTGLPLTGLPKVTSSDVNVIPASAGSVIGLGELMPDGAHRHAIAFGLHVPALRVENLTEESGTWQDGSRRTLQLTDRTMYVGTGYAYRLGESVRIGGAVHYVLRSVDVADRITFVRPGQDGQPVIYDAESDLKLQSGSAVAVLGVKILASEKLAMGLSVATQGLTIHHNGTYLTRVLTTAHDGEGTSYTPNTVDISNGPQANLGNVGNRMPWTLRWGVAWVEHAAWTLTADLSAFLPVNYDLVPLGGSVHEGTVPLVLRVQRDLVVNGAVGFERLIGRSMSLAVGSYTNLPSSPQLKSTGGVLDPGSSRLSRIPMVGLTAAAGLLSAFTLTRVGFMTAFGIGDRVTVRNGATAIAQPSSVEFLRGTGSEWTFYIFISSTFRYGSGRSARGDFGLGSLFGGEG